MNSLTATISELLQFVFIEWFGLRTRPAERPLALTMPKRELLVGSTVGTQDTANSEDKLKAKTEEKQYVSVQKAMVYEQPVQVFDGVSTTLPYGAEVKVLLSSGRWSHVEVDGISGWILRDELVSAASHVKPKFLIGELYPAHSTETKKLRSLISDEFGGGVLAQPLQDVEYILYRLMDQGKDITWPKDRPRIAGRWQRILAGRPGMHLSVEPSAGAIMETVREDGTGQLSYVEAVFPDQSLAVSSVGVPEEGQYNERTLPYREWRELRPIFIEVA